MICRTPPNTSTTLRGCLRSSVVLLAIAAAPAGSAVVTAAEAAAIAAAFLHVGIDELVPLAEEGAHPVAGRSASVFRHNGSERRVAIDSDMGRVVRYVDGAAESSAEMDLSEENWGEICAVARRSARDLCPEIPDNWDFDIELRLPFSDRCARGWFEWWEHEGAVYTGKRLVVIIGSRSRRVSRATLWLPPIGEATEPLVSEHGALAVVEDGLELLKKFLDCDNPRVLMVQLHRWSPLAGGKGPVWFVYLDCGGDRREFVVVDGTEPRIVLPALEPQRSGASGLAVAGKAGGRTEDAARPISGKRPSATNDGSAMADTVRAFLADSMLAPVPLATELVERAASTDTARTFAVGGSCVGLDSPGKRVIAYQAPRPVGPIPGTMLAEETLGVAARAFAEHHAPEVFAPGGAVLASVADGLSELGDRRFNFQRVEDGCRVPRRAEVGVRIWDGKVSWYRLDLSTYNPPLPPQLDLDAAQVAVLRQAVGEAQANVWWLDVYRELRQVEGQWNQVWVLATEVRPADERTDLAGTVQRWTVRDSDGRILGTEQVSIKGEGFRWYRAHGGEHRTHASWMRPEPLFRDTEPRWSPDGRQILFLSTRERAGWPGWLEAGPGVFMVDADGSGVRCLYPGPVLSARWAGNGDSIVVADGATVFAVDRSGVESVRFPAPTGWKYLKAERMPDGRLVALARKDMVQYRLHFLDPAAPSGSRRELPPWGEQRTLFGDLLAEAGGGLLVTVGTDVKTVGTRDPKRSRSPWSLYRLQPAQAATTPALVAEFLNAGNHLGPGPSETLLTGVWSTRWYLWDPASRTDRTWPAAQLRLGSTGATDAAAPPHLIEDVCFSPAGQRVAFAHLYWSGNLDDPAAVVLWVAEADGANARPLTLPTTDLAPIIRPGGGTAP